MPVKGCSIKLGQHIYFPDIGMKAIGDGDIDQSELSANGYGWFCPVFGQGIKPLSLPTS
jgi:hypothetical protein